MWQPVIVTLPILCPVFLGSMLQQGAGPPVLKQERESLAPQHRAGTCCQGIGLEGWSPLLDSPGFGSDLSVA